MVSIYTVGHSNRAQPEFITLLEHAAIDELVDVRAYPQSRRNPQFNRHTLAAALAEVNIRYRWAGEHMGGRRPVASESPHHALPVSLRGYADHMLGQSFAAATRRLRELADAARVAVMCAERDPAHCHRSLIADYLVAAGDNVTHLIKPGEQREHRLNEAARQSAAGLIYDRLTQAGLDLD